MRYFSHSVPGPLDEFVDRFWMCSDQPTHSRERILPSGTVEMVINLLDDEVRIYDPLHSERCKRFSGAVVSGTYSRCFMIDPLQHASIIGVHFKPGGAFPFLAAPADDLADMHVDLETLWGRTAAAELRERLCEATTRAQRFSLLENSFLARLQHPPKRHGAVMTALETFGQTGPEVRVRDLAGHVGLSQRQFIQVFADEVGLTPKAYSRIQRFRRARNVVQKIKTPDWAAVAMACGYYDQSHLIRDFQEFSGLSPMAYVNQRSEDVLSNHVPQPG